MKKDIRIVFYCKKCKKRMFDYFGGDVNLGMKCERCKRIFTLRGYDEKMILQNAENDKIYW